MSAGCVLIGKQAVPAETANTRDDRPIVRRRRSLLKMSVTAQAFQCRSLVNTSRISDRTNTSECAFEQSVMFLSVSSYIQVESVKRKLHEA